MPSRMMFEMDMDAIGQAYGLGTDPCRADTDGDGYADGFEVVSRRFIGEGLTLKNGLAMFGSSGLMMRGPLN